MSDTTTAQAESTVDVKALLEAGCHFGHQSKRWNPKMAEYIYTEKNGVHIFDLIKTAELLDKAIEAVRTLAAEGKQIVFIGTKRQAQEIVKQEAITAGAPYVTTRWFGGTITNWEQVSKSISRLNTMKIDRDAGKFDLYTKKERVLLDRDITRLERFLGGIATLTKIPDALFIADVGKDRGAVKEAVMKNIPVIAIVDSNDDPDGVRYMIPANNDAVHSISLMTHAIAQAYRQGKDAIKKVEPEKKKEEKKI